MIAELKKRWKGYKEKRFLESYGCSTWREYERKYDSDIDPRVGFTARWVHTYYRGYPFVFTLEPDGYIDLAYNVAHPYVDAAEKMQEWCEQNCQGKWRNDWHRGWWDLQGNFELNEIAGGDVMAFAFKEEADYVWFTLVWS